MIKCLFKQRIFCLLRIRDCLSNIISHLLFFIIQLPLLFRFLQHNFFIIVLCRCDLVNLIQNVLELLIHACYFDLDLFQWLNFFFNFISLLFVNFLSQSFLELFSGLDQLTFLFVDFVSEVWIGFLLFEIFDFWFT